MDLYLSSYQLGTQPEHLTALLGNNRRAAIVMNAADVFGDSRRPIYLQRYIDDLKGLGIEGIDLDLRRYFGKPDELRKIAESVGMFWVSGGNTFALRRAMRQSGLDGWLQNAQREGRDLVYGGFSAGICVLSPSLRGIHLGDEPENVPASYPSKEVIWDGLSMIDFYIVPHYRSPHPETEAMEKVANYCVDHRLDHELLRDGEAIVVTNGKRVKVGVPVKEFPTQH